MAGVELLLALICVNATCVPDNTTTDNDEFLVLNDFSNVVKGTRLKELREQLSGKHLTIATLQNYPLNFVEKSPNGTLTGKGIAFEFVNFLKEKFNFTYTVVLPEENLVGTENDLKGSIVELLRDGKVDFAAAFLPVLAPNRAIIRYSTSLDEGEWVILMKRPKVSAAGSGLLAPFDQTVWILILVSLICIGPAIYLLLLLRYWLTKDSYNQPYPLFQCVWFVYGALLKQGSTLSPVTDSTRLLFATWWIFITILTSFYTANLTAFLTLSKFTLPINEPKDLVNKNYRWVARKGSAVEYVVKNPEEVLLHNLNPMIENRRAVLATEDPEANILTKYVERDYVYIRDQPAVDHLMYNDYRTKVNVEESNRCTFVITTTTFMKKSRAFAYTMNSTLRELFDPMLLSLVESGIVKHMLRDRLPNTKICPMDLGSTERQLRNGDLVMTYLVVVTGFSIALAFFIGELIFRYFNLKDFFLLHFGKENNDNDIIPNKTKEVFVTPPPAYHTVFGKSHGKKNTPQVDSKAQIINGRQYFVVPAEGGNTRLIPVRTPSALLYQYTS